MWTENVYYDAEAHGLILLGEADLCEPDYCFDLLAVWKDKKGRYYLATDSGCSCPTPFEDYKAVDDLTGPLTAEQAREEAVSLWKGSYSSEYDPEGFNSLMAKVI